jgi:uncharacterized protein YdaU (DUF1376 family)
MKTPHIWMPLFIGDLDAAFKSLSHDEESCLIRLLMAYWTAGELPPEEKLPKLVGLSPKKWRLVKISVLHAFAVYCERTDMDGQRLKAAQLAAKNHERAKRGAAVRWQHQVEEAERSQSEVACSEHCLTNAPSPSQEKEEKRATKGEKPAGTRTSYTPSPFASDQDKALHRGPDSGLGSPKPNGRHHDH